MPDLPTTTGHTVGPMLFGIVGTSALYGISTVQMYMYYHYYPRDSQLHKLAVGLLWIMGSFHSGLLLHATYEYLIVGWGNIEAMHTIIWSVKLEVAINVTIVLIVQGLYAYRIWVLSGIHRRYLGYGVAALVIGGCALGVVFVYKLYNVHSYDTLDSISWAIIAALASSTAIDFILSGAMCYYLHKFQKYDDLDLDSKLSTIIQYTLSSGLATSTCSLATLFTYALLPHTYIFMGLEYLLVQFYICSFFALLCARDRKPKNSPATLKVNQPSRRPISAGFTDISTGNGSVTFSPTSQTVFSPSTQMTFSSPLKPSTDSLETV